MSVIVKHGKFVSDHRETLASPLYDSDILQEPHLIVPDGAGEIAMDELDKIPMNAASIKIHFATFTDGRGFSIARWLRQNGYEGNLRASGHLLADQYPLALRCGFDDVEITDEQALRQPQEQWADALSRVQSTYQHKLMAAPSNRAIAA